MGVMLRQMSQKELCYWIAFHKIENDKDELDKKVAADKEQEKKDEALKNLILTTWGNQTPSS